MHSATTDRKKTCWKYSMQLTEEETKLMRIIYLDAVLIMDGFGYKLSQNNVLKTNDRIIVLYDDFKCEETGKIVKQGFFIYFKLVNTPTSSSCGKNGSPDTEGLINYSALGSAGSVNLAKAIMTTLDRISNIYGGTIL